jgi:hypothetical protein
MHQTSAVVWPGLVILVKALNDARGSLGGIALKENE